MHPTIAEVTARIRDRSKETRATYLETIAAMRSQGPGRGRLSCGNLAHAFAAAPGMDKDRLRGILRRNIGIVNAFNDMLSAHQPLGAFPDIIKEEARAAGGTAQVAGGVPAMCDGVTQGQPGMELSLFSRDVIAMATAVALTHNAFDAAMCLGVCDKIVPGLFIGAASFGHLPIIFSPAGPMPSGIPNKKKAEVRALFAQGKVSRDELLAAESASYHSPGTCTFYGTANSNQMMMEVMGLHIPGSAFVHPGTELREAFTRDAARRLAVKDSAVPSFSEVIDAEAIVNAMVGLCATGGSTNHLIHLVAMARAAGLQIDWDDFADVSKITPLLTRIYPNGSADVNHFHAAGGMAFLIDSLLTAGLLHRSLRGVVGDDMTAYAQEAFLDDGTLAWRPAVEKSLDPDVLRPADDPFDHEGGIRLLTGNLGRSVIKISAVEPKHRVVEAPVRVFHDQEEVLKAFSDGKLNRDVAVVLRFQGPKANGMPELHKLSPVLGVLQDKGFAVALITDGRMSGASGKTPAAIHLTPEATDGGPIARVRDGDILRLDAKAGTLDVQVPAEEFQTRTPAHHTQPQAGLGRELFAMMRAKAGGAEEGASIFFGSGLDTVAGVESRAAEDSLV